MRRRNSSLRRSRVLVVRKPFHCEGGKARKVNSSSPASSRLAATTGQRAAERCPSLYHKKISPHVLRHTTAMLFALPPIASSSSSPSRQRNTLLIRAGFSAITACRCSTNTRPCKRAGENRAAHSPFDKRRGNG